MGKWKYINLLILIVAIIYMYLHIHTNYGGNTTAYIAASLGIVMLYALGHYIFVHNIKKQGKNKKITTQPPSKPKPEKPRPKARPKVILKQKPNKNG